MAIFFGKSCNASRNVQYFPESRGKIFETEISAHVGCALGTPNFLEVVGINPPTSSLNRIFLTFFLEKKSGGEGQPPQSRKTRIFTGKVLSWAAKVLATFEFYTRKDEFKR